MLLCLEPGFQLNDDVINDEDNVFKAPDVFLFSPLLRFLAHTVYDVTMNQFSMLYDLYLPPSLWMAAVIFLCHYTKKVKSSFCSYINIK